MTCFFGLVVAYTLTVPSFALKPGSLRKSDAVAEAVEWLRFWPEAQAEESAVGRLWRRLTQASEAEGQHSSRTSALLDQGAHQRYMTFETDPGGLNNMRMAFEYFVDVAKKSNRVLVLPPQEGWYLLDWGPLNSKAEKVEDRTWIKGDHNSSYQEFWDTDYLGRQGVPTVSAEDFYAYQKERLHIPESAAPLAKLVNSPDPSPWKLWLREHADAAPEGCENGRQTAMDQDLTHVHFGKGSDIRFLECVPAPNPLVHYSPKIFELAATPIAKMGPAKFVALHLRRNDFQYTQAPKGEEAQKLVEHLGKFLHPQESVYVASDEVNEAWWSSLRETLAKSNHELYTLKSFETPEMEARGLSFRHSGPVEQLICAGARRFWGTEFSTFTQGIQDMRQHITEKKTWPRRWLR